MNTTELKALAEAVKGWKLRDVLQTPDDKDEGIAFVGHQSDVGIFDDIVHIDTGNYMQPHMAIVIATYYAAANPDAMLALIADLESAQDERRALLATEQNLREELDVSKELLRLADIMRDCGRLVSKSGSAEIILRTAASLLSSAPPVARPERVTKEMWRAVAESQAELLRMKNGQNKPEQAQPAERKPLSEEQIREAVTAAGMMFTHPDLNIARAIERAHGIGD